MLKVSIITGVTKGFFSGWAPKFLVGVGGTQNFWKNLF